MTYKNEYLIEQYKTLHNSKKGYGNGYNKNTLDLEHLNSFLKNNNSRSILDYGCGKGDLVKYLTESYSCYGYDPSIEKYNNEHNDKNFDTLICLDVLEHIPENELGHLFEHIKSYNTKNLYFIVSTRYAKTKLPDGRNCHETVKSYEWWVDLFIRLFLYKKLKIENKN